MAQLGGEPFAEGEEIGLAGAVADADARLPPINPTTEAMLTMSPRPRAARPGATARASRSGDDVERDHRLEPVGIHLDRRPGDGDAGIVDEQRDIVAAQPRLDLAAVAGIGQVGAEHLGLDAGLLPQPRREFLEPDLVAGDQHEVIAPVREPIA